MTPSRRIRCSTSSPSCPRRCSSSPPPPPLVSSPWTIPTSPIRTCKWPPTPPRRESRLQGFRRGRARSPPGRRWRLKARCTSPGSRTQAPRRNRVPAADSARPSTLPTLCRNIVGGSSAASPPSLVIGGVYVASRQQSAARALARQRAGLPGQGSSGAAAMQEEDDYEPAEVLAKPGARPAQAARPSFHAARRTQRRTLPARSRAQARPNLASGIRDSQVRPRSNPGARPETRSAESLSRLRTSPSNQRCHSDRSISFRRGGNAKWRNLLSLASSPALGSALMPYGLHLVHTPARHRSNGFPVALDSRHIFRHRSSTIASLTGRAAVSS